MGWLRIALTPEEQRIVQRERESHANACVRRRLWVVWLLHCGETREQTARILGLAVSTVQRVVRNYRCGGLEALRKTRHPYRPRSELEDYRDVLRQEFEQRPARTIAEACQRIKDLTGVDRKPTQVRRFLKQMGLKWQRVRAIPVPPKKTLLSTRPIKRSFSTKS